MATAVPAITGAIAAITGLTYGQLAEQPLLLDTSAAAVSEALKKAGVPASAIRFDDANKRIPVPTQTGNLIVDLPGTKPGPRLMFSTHLDTVPLCAGAKPKRSIIVILFAAEEQGLVGSQAWLKKHPEIAPKVVMMINRDSTKPPLRAW